MFPSRVQCQARSINERNKSSSFLINTHIVLLVVFCNRLVQLSLVCMVSSSKKSLTNSFCQSAVNVSVSELFGIPTGPNRTGLDWTGAIYCIHLSIYLYSFLLLYLDWELYLCVSFSREI